MLGNEKIDILIARFLSGEALPEEAMELEDWINESPENRAYFDRYSVFFETPHDLSPNDKQQAWTRLTGTKPFNWRWIGIAASVMLIVAVSLLLGKYNKDQPGNIIHQAGTIAKNIILKDSSEVIVSPNSSITIDREYGVHNRKITLKGSASFSVIHNPSNPLIVNVNTFHIKDVGTKFSIVTDPVSDTIDITVTEGKIAAYDDFGASEMAGAGEKLYYLRSGRKFLTLPANEKTIRSTPPSKETPNPIVRKEVHKEIRKEVQNEVLAKPRPDSPIADRLIPYQILPDNIDSARRAIAGRPRDSTPSERIVADLVRDHLITRGKPLNFKLSDTAFILNGVKQPETIWKWYRDKYGGVPVPAGWSWGHRENNP